MTAVDAASRRMAAAVVFLLAVIVISSLWRGDSLAMTFAYALATVLGGGFVIACYQYVRRKD